MVNQIHQKSDQSQGTKTGAAGGWWDHVLVFSGGLAAAVARALGQNRDAALGLCARPKMGSPAEGKRSR